MNDATVSPAARMSRVVPIQPAQPILKERGQREVF